jgi:membrane fusion protein, multidrug efflux system
MAKKDAEGAAPASASPTVGWTEDQGVQRQTSTGAPAGTNGDPASDNRTTSTRTADRDPAETAPQELVQVPRSPRPWGVLLAIVVVISSAALLASRLIRGATHPSTSDAYVEGRVVRISPRVAGQVIALHVDDNSKVQAGDTLLEIDPADYQAKVDQERAAVSIATSSIQQADAAVARAVAAVGEADAAVGSTMADANHRAADYKRYQAVGTDGVSAQQLDAAKTAAEVGERQREAAEKKLTAAGAELDVARANAASARSRLAAAEAQLRFAELQLHYAKVVAPESGVVTKKNVEVGSFVSTAQPLMAIIPNDYWVVANFKEVQLERIRVGQPVAITVDAFPGLRFEGRVESLQAGTGARFQLLPPENATGNWVKVVQRVPVKITIARGQAGLDRMALGMSLDVEVDTQGRQAEGAVSSDEQEGR